MNIHKIWQGIVVVFIVFLLAGPGSVAAQDDQGAYSREQLTQMLAPIALYQDALLSQVLMAATYPLEVVAADRWIRKNPLLTGENLNRALIDQDWDASIKALCHIPTVLAMMSERLDETTNLGNAFLAQEDEVMDVVQELRSRAYRERNLRSDDKQKVTLKIDGTIIIEPADPQTVYVPYYNTRYVYGSWWYPAWPPWYWGPGEIVVGRDIYFWPNVYVGFNFGFGYWSHFDWPGRTIIIDVHQRPRFFRPDHHWPTDPGRWHHEPDHRRGVVYRDRSTAERFGQVRGPGQVYDRKVRGFPERDQSGRPTGRPPTETRRDNNMKRPDQNRESIKRNETPRSRERSTIFDGEGNGREENQSSARGRNSRGDMDRNRPQQRSPSGNEQREERGGGGNGGGGRGRSPR
ncbi:MAG: DUF3300 domain-containing protein [Proteobacteria bacterium]|nr:DUF3300 domain-containing protein [Pseudomonadota bacterium]MBU1716055.1 DUF3300 domain-containing protein [Pseudomonadota bacterium]